MNRIEQDAHHYLLALEAQAAFRASVKARWAKAQPPVIVGTWSPTMTEQQRKEHEQYVIEQELPF